MYHSKSSCSQFQVFWRIGWFWVRPRGAQMLFQAWEFYSCSPFEPLIVSMQARCGYMLYGCILAHYPCQLEQLQSFWSILWHPRLCEWCSSASYRFRFQAVSFARLWQPFGLWACYTLRKWSHSPISSASLGLLHFEAFFHQHRACFYRCGLDSWAYSSTCSEFGLDCQAFASLPYGFKVCLWAACSLGCHLTGCCDILGFWLSNFPIQSWVHRWDYFVRPICFGMSLSDPSRACRAYSSNRKWLILCRRAHVWELVSWILWLLVMTPRTSFIADYNGAETWSPVQLHFCILARYCSSLACTRCRDQHQESTSCFQRSWFAWVAPSTFSSSCWWSCRSHLLPIAFAAFAVPSLEGAQCPLCYGKLSLMHNCSTFVLNF